jgi:hypothetical protein
MIWTPPVVELDGTWRRILRGSKPGGEDTGRPQVAASAHCRPAANTVGAGVRSCVVKALWLPRATLEHQIGSEAQSGAAISDQSPHKVVVVAAEREQLGSTVRASSRQRPR